MLEKLFNPEWQITSNSFLLSTFLIGFSFSPTAEISRLELEFEESLPRKTALIFKEGIGQESNGAANQEKQIFLLYQISPPASSTRDLGTRLRKLHLLDCTFSATGLMKQQTNFSRMHTDCSMQPTLHLYTLTYIVLPISIIITRLCPTYPLRSRNISFHQ